MHKHTKRTEMTYSKLQKRLAMRRKLLILRKLTNSKSVKRSSIIFDAFLYIYKLKLWVEALQREYLHLMQHIQDVKVEKLEKGFLVRVTCKKGPNTLLLILEAFENMGLRIVHSRIMCNYFFGMEAIVEVHERKKDQAMDVREVTQTLLKAVAQSQTEVESL